MAYANKQEWDSAIANCTKAMEFRQHLDKSDLLLAYAYCSLAHLQTGHLKEAIASATQAIELDPNFVQAYFIRGQAYAKKQEIEAAIFDLRKVMKLSKDLRQEAEVLLKRLQEGRR